MIARISTVERALQIAASGSANSYTSVLRQLAREGYPDVRGHLDGWTIRKQIKDLVDGAKASDHGPAVSGRRSISRS